MSARGGAKEPRGTSAAADKASPPAAALPGRWELSARSQNLVALLLLFLITIPMLTKIFTSDFGTHLALGRQIVQTRTIPDTEFLNYPSLGRPNANAEWGFEAVLYLVYAAGGGYGVSFFCWLIVFGIFVLLHRATVLRGANPLIAVLAIFAFSGFLRIRIQPRPEIFTYFFVALTIFLFSEYFFGKRKRLIFLFPLVVLVWANSHPTYLMAFLLCGAFIADRLANAMWRKELQWGYVRSTILTPAALGVLALVLCGLNPYGYDALLLPLHLISRGTGGGGGGGSQVLMAISELTPVKGTGFYAYYKAAVVFAAVSLCLGLLGRRVYVLDLFLFAIAFKGAWDSARAVSMMGLFLSPGISLHLTGFLAKTEEWFAPAVAIAKQPARRSGKGKASPSGKAVPNTPSAPPRTSLGHIATTAVVLFALGAFGGTTLAFSFSQLEYGIGITQHKFSFKAAEFLRRNPIPGRMFNFFDIGGFLDWQLYPQALTFIDGRTYNQEVFAEHQMITAAMPGWDNVLRKYGVTYIVLKSMDSSGMILPIVPALANDPGWSLVFSDGLVFVRNSPPLREYVLRHQIPKGVIPQHIIQEAYHYTFLGVSPIVAYQTMSNMYMVMGRRDLAIDALRKALEEAGDNPYLRDHLMRLEREGSGTR
jgi:hypothetical protein